MQAIIVMKDVCEKLPKDTQVTIKHTKYRGTTIIVTDNTTKQRRIIQIPNETVLNKHLEILERLIDSKLERYIGEEIR